MKKGIVDPWRVVTPLVAEKRKEREPLTKIDPAEIDFDADLRPHERCVFASPHGSVIISGQGISSTDVGLVTLVRCLNEISGYEEGRDLLDKAGVRFAFDHEPQPWGGLRTTDEGTKVTLYFEDQTHTEGMLRLIKALNTISRRPGPTGAGILKRWGVSTMMR